MSKSLFKTKSEVTQKKISFVLSSDIVERIEKIERRAENAGVSFPLNDHVVDAVERLLAHAEKQLDALAKSAADDSLPVPRSPPTA